MHEPSTPYAPKTNALQTLKDKLYFHTLPSYGNKIFYGLGFLALTCLTLLAATGAILAILGQTWWLESSWGIFTRSVHLWSVQALVVLLILHGLVGFTTSGFKAPRRMVWVFGMMLFCLALIQSEFGYGLRGDFSSQFRAASGADFWNGAYFGSWLNPLSHLQEFALHVAIIPLAILVLFIMHYLLERTYGIAKPYRTDVSYTMVPANHTVMYIRGVVLVAAIMLMAYFFHSPYVPAIRIADVAQQNPSLVAATLQQEYDQTSDTATYLDSIDPYTFNTRQTYLTAPYFALTQSAEATGSAAMIQALMPAVHSGAYEAVLDSQDPAPHTYTLRLLSDMGVLEAKAGELGFDTQQWGMAKDETNGALLPPGSWWFAPIGMLNSTLGLLDNPNGDRIAAELLGLLMLVFIAFPYIPYLNRLPELLNLAPLIWRK